jgi:hypothetical protein
MVKARFGITEPHDTYQWSTIIEVCNDDDDDHMTTTSKIIL